MTRLERASLDSRSNVLPLHYNSKWLNLIFLLLVSLMVRYTIVETFIVDDSAIYEKVHLASLSRALYVDSYNLIHTTSSIGVNGNITDS